MAEGSKKAVAVKAKPEKPYDGFPLFPHATGLWAKKVRGQMRYFGPWSDPEAALQKWLDQRDDLLAGREPTERREGLRLRELVSRFRAAKEGLLAADEITARTYGS